jgi:xanthine dehydrogenase large subunit
MYGIGVYYALLAAIQAFRPSADLPVVAPMTPERVLMTLYGDRLAELRGLKNESERTVSR